MIITSVQNTQNYNQTTQKTNTQNTTKASFGELLEQSQEPQKEYKSKFLQYLGDDPLKGFSEEKKRLYGDILSDDKITMDEIDKLNYKDTKELLDFVHNSYSGKNDIMNMPLVHMDNQVSLIGSTSRLTNNETFNEALSEFMRNSNLSDIERTTINTQVQKNLSQAYFNKKVEPDFIYDAFSANIIDVFEMNEEKKNIDYENFLSNIVSSLGNELNNSELSQDLKKQYQLRYDAYSSIAQNYEKIKNRPTQIYV